MSRKIEVFTAGCPVCEQTLNAVREATRKCGCEVVERRVGAGTFAEAERLGIKALPAIAIDGVVVFEGRPTTEQAKALFTL